MNACFCVRDREMQGGYNNSKSDIRRYSMNNQLHIGLVSSIISIPINRKLSKLQLLTHSKSASDLYSPVQDLDINPIPQPLTPASILNHPSKTKNFPHTLLHSFRKMKPGWTENWKLFTKITISYEIHEHCNSLQCYSNKKEKTILYCIMKIISFQNIT